MNEIKLKDTVLEEDGKLIRCVEFVTIVITYNDLKLKEDRQEFSDGRVRKRNKDGVAEKMKKGEVALNSAIRGIQEELGVTVQEEQLEFIKESNIESDSHSYPGLSARYKKYLFNCELTEEQFNPEGYIELQENLKTFFIWEQ